MFFQAAQPTKQVQIYGEDLESIARILTGVAAIVKEAKF
jgi:hypothetical protein